MKLVLLTINQKSETFKTTKNVNNPSVSTYKNHACVVFGPQNVGKS